MARPEILIAAEHIAAARRELEKAAAAAATHLAPAVVHMHRANLIATANAHAQIAQAVILDELLDRARGKGLL